MGTMRTPDEDLADAFGSRAPSPPAGGGGNGNRQSSQDEPGRLRDDDDEDENQNDKSETFLGLFYHGTRLGVAVYDEADAELSICQMPDGLGGSDFDGLRYVILK
jgi:hypothetical protein